MDKLPPLADLRSSRENRSAPLHAVLIAPKNNKTKKKRQIMLRGQGKISTAVWTG